MSGDQDESTLDVEWSGAVAPAATVKFVVGSSTQTTDGVDLSAQYVVNHATAPVVSTSYGSCEQDMGATELSFYNALWQQAASQGMSAFVSSGDAGASGCDSGSSSSGSGRAVNGLCSSPYSTCVGGTEFNEGSNPAEYWSATNTSSYGSALSYIPEEVWNESGSNGGSGLWASGGGASVVYAEPAWQKTVSGTSAAGGMRAVPDVAMAAAGHDGYIMVENGSFWVISGTSAASPTFAGVMALVVQSKGGTGQGNANAGLYPLVNASRNPFHATPSGNNSVPSVSGYTASGGTYNLATGLGSVDGALLVSAWGGSTTTALDFTLTPSATTGTVQTGKTATFTLSVVESGSAKNAVALSAKAPTGVTVGFSPTSIAPGTTATVTITVSATAAAGAQTITITGADASGTQNVTYSLTVTQPPTLTLTEAASSVVAVQGGSGTLSLTATTAGSFTGNITYSLTGLPAGVTAAWSANPTATVLGATTNSETLTLTAAAASIANSSIIVTAAGDGLVSSQTFTLQVQQAPSVTLAVSPTTVQVQALSTATLTVTATPLGGVTFGTSGALIRSAGRLKASGASAISIGAFSLAAASNGGASISVVSGLPKGFTATFGSPTVNSAGSIVWTLTLTGSSSAVAASSTLNLTAQVTAANTGLAYTASAAVPITVTAAAPSLTVSPASTAVSVTQGKTATEVVSLAGNSSYSGAVTLSVSGLPSGVTASWSSNPTTLTSESGSSTLTLTASSTASVTSATVTITASGDAITASKQITVQVIPLPSLTVSPASTAVSVVQGKTATEVVSLAGNSSYSGAVTLSVSGLPSGVTASWSSNPATLTNESGSSTLTLTASSTASVTSATVTITVSGDGVSASKQITVQVALPPPALTVSAASSAVSVVQGKAVTDVVSLAGNASYTGPVSLSVSGLPSGVTASWSSNPVTLTSENGSSTLTLTGSSAASLVSATVTITASGDATSATKQITVQALPAPSLTIAAASTSLSVVPGQMITDVITLTGDATYSGAATFSVTGLPTGVSASWSSNPATFNGESASSTLTLTASSTAAPGSVTIKVAASGDGLTPSLQIALQVTQPPSVQMTLSASSLTMVHTSAGSISLTVKTLGGLSPVGSFMLSGLPAGITPSLSNINTSTAGTMTLTLNFQGSAAARAGTSTITITATCSGGGKLYSAAQQLSLILK